MCENNIIYLDYAANTPVDEKVLKAYVEASKTFFANPNSTHCLGKIAKNRVDEVTTNILDMLKKNINISDDMEIIYTSGSSESNNLAIKGLARAYRENGKHMISTFLEHSSVSAPLTFLKEQGYEIDILRINEDGKIDIENLEELIRDDTILVSISVVDSEIGTIQNIERIAKIIKKHPNCYLHVDATQGFGKINMNLQDVDMITFAPHKFYGLNGFGALLKKKDIVLEPIISGGTSTSIYRSGTPVLPQIVAMEEALKQSFSNLNERFDKVLEEYTYLQSKLNEYSQVRINSKSYDNPFILNLSINGVKAVEFKEELEKYGVCISIKSACSVVISPSKAVMAMTHDRKRALSSWRISLSHLVTMKEINEFLRIFDICYKKFCS